MHLYHNSAESSCMSTKNAAQSTTIKIGMQNKKNNHNFTYNSPYIHMTGVSTQ